VLLEIAPRERIAGVHSLAGDPRFSLCAAEVQGLRFVGAEPEQLLAFAPDLVIVDAFTRPETIALLQWAGVPLLRPNEPMGFPDIATNIRGIGHACHLEAPAEALVARMETKLRALAAHATEAAGWQLCSLDGDLHTYGRGSLVDAMLTAAGARNLAAERGAGPFRKLTVETLLAWQPEGLLVADHREGTELGPPAWLTQVPGLDLLSCAQHHRFLFVPGAMLGTTSHRLADTAAFVQAALKKWERS
jgi:iron complex transport system substrate-binding protein